MHERTFVRSGGRQPAVVREPHRQARLRRCAHAVFAAHTVVARRIRSGGREPAVVREPRRQARLRRCSRAVFTAHAVVGRKIRSGGRQPAVVRNRTGKHEHAQVHVRSSRGGPRAAGVSPPWVGNRTGNHDCVHVHARPPAQRRQSSERSRQCPCKCVTANHGGLRPPLLWRSPVNGNRNRLSKRRFTQHGG